ncbi:unnamed protein product, partial [Ectocarpus sp. 4 AP-2014]
VYRPLGRGADGSSSDGRVALAAVIVAGGPGAIPVVVVVVVGGVFPRRQLLRSRPSVLQGLLIEVPLFGGVVLVLILAAATAKNVGGGHTCAIAATLLCDPLRVGYTPPRRHLAGLQPASAATTGVALLVLS